MGFACQLVKLVWLTPKVGIALADDIPYLLRSTDEGATWSRKELPGDRGFFRLERFGTRLWVYGVHIARSDDLGETWKALPAPMTGRIPVSLGMSFESKDHGWLSSLSGTLWETSDGGDTWKQIGADAFHGEVVLLDSSHGFVSGANGLVYETQDDGKTWQTCRRPEEDLWRPAVADPVPGRLPRIIEAPGSPSSGLPLLDHRLTAVDSERVVHTAKWVSWYRRGQLESRGPLLGPASKVRVLLTGSAPTTGLTRLGWSASALFRSEDGGQTWLSAGVLPEAFAEVRALQDGAFVGRGGSGAVYRAEDAESEWRRSNRLVDSYLLDPLGKKGNQGVSKTPVPPELGRFGAQLPLSLRVEFGVTGYGDSRPGSERLQNLRIYREQGRVYIEGGVYRADQIPLRQIPKSALTAEQAEAIRRGLLAALLEPSASECNVSDVETVVRLRIRCIEQDRDLEETKVEAGGQAICNGSRFFRGELRHTREPATNPAFAVTEYAREVLAELEASR